MRADFAAAVVRGVQYSTERLRAPSPAFVASFSTFLAEPTNSHRKFLLLDLDETLIHTQRQPVSKTEGKVTLKMSVRPFAAQFLRELSAHFEIYVFSAGQRGYAEAAVEKLNRKAVIIKDILSREHCFETRKGRFLKDLRIIRNRGLEDLVIVDNLVESFGLQLDNGVPILEFRGSEDDRELLGLIPFLKHLSLQPDVRPALRQKYGLLSLCRPSKENMAADSA
jgi:CTD small phosphatase-like protein 2